MTEESFEKILDKCCAQLTEEARLTGFRTSSQFENRVREVLADITREVPYFEIDFNPHPQAFPDIAIGEYGVEVKFTLNDTWRSIANSVLETQRIDDVKHIYVVFGKMGGVPEVRWNRVLFMLGRLTFHALKSNFQVNVMPSESRYLNKWASDMMILEN